MTEEKLYQLLLHLTPNVGPKLAKLLISNCGSVKEVFYTKKRLLEKIPGIGERIAQEIINQSKQLERAESELQCCQEEGVQILFYSDQAFPQRLKEYHDSPLLLYYKGNVDLNTKKVISIVGTRKATSYGKDITEEIISQFPKDMLVISGLAYGIDIQAHKSALNHQIPTIGVMASGIESVFPTMHRHTAKHMLEHGGILTEEPFGTIPEPPKFPARNRIIAGMSDCTLVVEAAIKGGALITARIANSYHKEVFSVPGNVDSTYSEGTNFIIKNHEAHLVESAHDIIKHMNWEEDVAGKQLKMELLNLSEDEERIVNAFGSENTIGLEELSWKTNINLNKLASLLLTLELQGIIKTLPGNKYKLKY